MLKYVNLLAVFYSEALKIVLLLKLLSRFYSKEYSRFGASTCQSLAKPSPAKRTINSTCHMCGKGKEQHK